MSSPWYIDYLEGKYYNKDGIKLNRLNHLDNTDKYNELKEDKIKLNKFIQEFLNEYPSTIFFNEFWSGNIYDQFGLQMYTRNSNTNKFSSTYQTQNQILLENTRIILIDVILKNKLWNYVFLILKI